MSLILIIAILGVLAAAAVLEAVLLHAIDFRSLGGSAQPAEAYLYSLIWAAVPFIWTFLVISVAAVWRRSLKRATAPLLLVSAIGPALAYFALTQDNYDSSERSLIVGFALQCIGAFVATVLVALPPNLSIQSGRAQARAADFER